MVIFSPGSGIWQYSVTRSSLIQSRVTQEGGGTWLAAALYRPSIQFYASLCRVGYEASSASISPPTSSVLRRRSNFKLTLIGHLRLRISDWSWSGSWSVDTLVFTNLHVDANIHMLFRASRSFGFVLDLHRVPKSPSSLVG